MKPNLYTSFKVFLVLAMLSVGTLGSFALMRGGVRDPMRRVPRIVLWAWERRENLDFIDPDNTAVAYLACTLDLAGDAVLLRPRLQPLTVPPRATLIAVIRIEDDRRLPPNLSAAQLSAAARIIPQFVRASASALQIDFDARQSERVFYRDLLIALRHRLPAALPISITALASWCLDDNWIASLPVDEAVPMLYRMGPDSKEIASYLRSGGDFNPPLSRSSVGVSLDQPLAGVTAGKRVYLFSPRPWTAALVRDAIAQVAR